MTEDSGEQQAAAAHSGTADVFVSYASQDAAIANETVEILEKQGISCWIAPRDVIAGAHYADAIITAISGAKAMILLLSDSALASKHVGKEVERASSKGRPIIALRTGVAPLSPAFEYFLSESQWIDVGANGVSGVAAKLIEAVRIHLQPSAATAPSPARAGPPAVRPIAAPRRLNGILAGSAVILVLLLTYFAVDRFRSAKPHAEAGPATGSATTATAEKSVAVLPFVDMSEKHDQEYFSDGLSEELIDHLARIPDLKVIARTSAFAFKGKNEDVRSIATKLGVSNVLEGSVRKAGGKLRIAAQLIRATDGAHVWSDTYTRDLSDIFALQDEIATTVANALNATLNATAAPAPRSGTRGTANVEAYKLLLQGHFYFWRGDQGDDNRAVEAFRQALQLDPQYALAWAKLARVYAWETFMGELSPAEGEVKGHEAAQRALAIDPKCAEAYFARGNIARFLEGDWSAAMSDFERATALDPNGEVGDAGRSNWLTLQAEMSGKFEDFLAWEHQRLERNPLDTDILVNLAGLQQLAGQLDQSAATFRKLLDLNPEFTTGHAQYALTLLLMGKNAEALAAAKLDSDEASKLASLACIYWAMGRRPESDTALTALERGFADRNQYLIAQAHAYRGEADAAFSWLDRAYQHSKGSLEPLKIDWFFRKLHGDARYAALLRKAKLPV